VKALLRLVLLQVQAAKDSLLRGAAEKQAASGGGMKDGGLRTHFTHITRTKIQNADTSGAAAGVYYTGVRGEGSEGRGGGSVAHAWQSSLQQAAVPQPSGAQVCAYCYIVKQQ
jgi:hypothetical protein